MIFVNTNSYYQLIGIYIDFQISLSKTIILRVPNCHLLQSEFKQASFQDCISNCLIKKKGQFYDDQELTFLFQINTPPQPKPKQFLLFIWTLNNSKARISFYTNFKMAFNINALSRISYKVLFYHSRHVQHSTKTNSILGRVHVQ